MSKTVRNAVRSVALVLKKGDMEITAMVIANAVSNKLDELHDASDQGDPKNPVVIPQEMIDKLSDSVTRAVTDRITEELTNIRKQITETSTTIADSTSKVADNVRSYRDALQRTLPTANGTALQAEDPRIQARKEVRTKQVLIDFTEQEDKVKFRNTSLVGIVETANSALKEAGISGADRFVSAAKMANRGILLEGSSNALVTKVNGDATLQMFLEAFSQSAVMRTRTYNTVAYFVPLSGIRSDNGQDLREIEEANRLQPNSIAGFRWIKHPSRRSPTQVMGHAIVSFKNPQAANSAIANGLVICQKRVNVAKDKKEPTRCMKCQKWGHMAIACLSAGDVCGQCGGAHRTTQCQGERVFCTPCGEQGHPSWDRDCPTFIAKRREMDGRTPDNLLTYFPTDEAWTHATVKSPWTANKHMDFEARQSSQPMPIGGPVTVPGHIVHVRGFPLWEGHLESVVRCDVYN